jgi:chromosomal replication initiator protein
MKKKDKKRKSTVTKILQEHIEHTKDFKNPYAVPGIEKTLTVTPTALINHVLMYYNITHKEAFGRGRTKEIAHARQICFYLLYENKIIPTVKAISILFGRDHSTVVYGVHTVRNEIKIYNRIEQEVSELQKWIDKA